MQILRSPLSRAGLLATAAAAALTFAAAPASAVAPSVSLTPATGLTNGQSLTVDGAGYTPGTQIAVAQCVQSTQCAAAFVIAIADADGDFQVDHSVYTTFQATDYETGASVLADCAVQQCQVVAWQEATGPVGADITFS